MKNIEKKWMLFLIATFVTFFGIGYTLLKETFAISNHIDENKNVDNYSDMYETDLLMSSECVLSNIVLSEGKIEFDKNVMEYFVTVSSFDDLQVTPVLKDTDLFCEIERKFVEEDKSILVTVSAVDGDLKTYKINVIEKDIDDNEGNMLQDKNNKDYTLLFISIICILVLINIYRIVKNKRSK